MSEIYFENVCDIGNLYLEKVFNRFEDENIIFICTDDNSNRYLCLCYEFRFSLKWIIAKITIRNIARLISSNIDISSIYDLESENLIHIVYHNDVFRYERLRLSQLEENILPKQGIFLKTDEKVITYFNYLCSNFLTSKRYSCERFLKYNIETQNWLNNMKPVYCSGRAISVPYNLKQKHKSDKEYSFVNIEEAA